MPMDIIALKQQIQHCRICEGFFEHSPRPVVQIHPKAKILIAGQAPGTRVHNSGVPFDDPSGDLLREWLGVGRTLFYDETLFAIVPMGFCYPGKGKSGDLPPRPECADAWRNKVLSSLQDIELTVLIGQYAQKWHLKSQAGKSVTETVQNWESFQPRCYPTPHPSPRNRIWLKKNPWFEQDVVPSLQSRVAAILKDREMPS